jgi:hypothetical protein
MAKHETTQQIERDKRWAERWEKARDFGRWPFIWMRGVVGWGAPWAVFMLARRWWDTGLRPALPDIPITIVVAIGGGIAFGAFTWRSAERRYQRWLASHSTTVARLFE